MYTWRLAYRAGALGSALIGAGPAAAFEIETADPSAIDDGAAPVSDGWVDFGLHAPAAKTVDLLLYDVPDAACGEHCAHGAECQSATTGAIRVRGSGIGSGTLYLYRASGAGNGCSAGAVRNRAQRELRARRSVRLSHPGSPLLDGLRRQLRSSMSRQPVYAGGGKSVVYDHTADPTPSHVGDPS